MVPLIEVAGSTGGVALIPTREFRLLMSILVNFHDLSIDSTSFQSEQSIIGHPS
jgi:hypothetical protein